jgi:uncharacterized protein (TIGR00730 family)
MSPNHLSNQETQHQPLTVSLDSQETIFDVVQEAVFELWNVVNGLTSIQSPKRERYRVTIFGSARIEENTPIYQDVRRLASELTKIGCDIVTGGGPGLMAAANEGSVIADLHNQTQSIGIRVDLEFDQDTNPFVEQVYKHRTFFSRLHHFVLVSDAFVVFPGGIGTSLEAFMIWQLLQVRQIHGKPLIFVGKMWSELVEWATENMVNGQFQMADPIDMKIPYCVNNVDEAMVILRQFNEQQKW